MISTITFPRSMGITGDRFAKRYPDSTRDPGILRRGREEMNTDMLTVMRRISFTKGFILWIGVAFHRY